MNMEYWVGVVNVLNPISFTLTVVGAMATGFLLLELYSPTVIKDTNKVKVPVIVTAVITVVFLLLLVFVPSADAIRAMYR
jgi:hypothetical protein|nr:MAG TPA: hypothetical protein [Caudoviricetes sp.]